jgi:hypothetical protein
LANRRSQKNWRKSEILQLGSSCHLFKR